ncbi:hypothetical protein GWI33_012704 [Rhynchophorus ferrugineus]|uniref:Uncharacterized protein n=1 Tax=Rhynchophorus ferrugineus TaxID=354439 RepID=A0A834MDX1_RHYFE|nr:hypothetical protein GWI33_012704 [Rhynchophorus ferrugineus]
MFCWIIISLISCVPTLSIIVSYNPIISDHIHLIKDHNPLYINKHLNEPSPPSTDPDDDESDHNSPQNYKYSYGVKDSDTGDAKQQYESREGNVVKGSYTIADPDGTLRTVHYTADENGFRAVVKREGEPVYPKSN